MNSIFELVLNYSSQTPDRAVILSSGIAPLSYRSLAEHINTTIRDLRRAGIAREDRIVVVLPEGVAGAVACLSVMCGAVCAPLNPSYSVSEFEMFITALGAKAVLLEKSDQSPMRGVAVAMGLKILELQSSSNSPLGSITFGATPQLPDHSESLPDENDTALLLFTSGTSARPKLVPLSQKNIVASALCMVSALNLTSADRCQSVMPLHHIHGLSTLFSTVASGGSFISISGFSPDRFFASLRENNPTWYSASPTIHRSILQHVNLLGYDARACGLRFIRSASAPMPQNLIPEIEETFGAPFVEAYGMTEAAPQIATNRLPPFQRKPGSVGTAAGPELAVMDEQGTLLLPEAIGEVVIRGDSVTRGYVNDADQTAFTGGWLRTGDLGYLDADGYLFITGRLKEIINRGGEKISPYLIESVLLEHPAIEDAAVFAVAHPVLGENVAAAVVLRPYFRESLFRAGPRTEREKHFIDEIREFTATRLAHFEIPQQIAIVDKIPFGATGKVIRADLAKLLESSTISSDKLILQKDGALPRTATESRITTLFADILKLPAVGIFDNFFQLGGDSISAMQVIARLENVFQIRLPFNTLFERPTVAQLSEHIGERLCNLIAEGQVRIIHDSCTLPQETVQENCSRSISDRAYPHVAPASFTQEQVFIADQLGSGSAYNISAPLWLSGTLCVNTLTRTVNEICRRHESLRTTFRITADGLQQIIHEPHHQSFDAIEIVDLRGIAEADRQQEAERLAAEDAATKFNLSDGPLLRIKLIRVGENQHLLTLVMHHIIADGWSTGILYREIKELYGAFIQQKPAPLDELSCQFSDFANWQRGGVSKGRLHEQIAFWHNQLADFSPPCTITPDRTRPRVSTYRGAILESSLAPSTVRGLNQVGQSCQSTLFMTFLAAFKTLLLRHSAQTDCAVGVPMANRTRAEFEPVIGFFANTLVLRTDLGGDPTFLELLSRVKATALSAAANQEVPLEHIVEKLNIERDMIGAALFQVMFAYQNLHSGDASASSGGLPPGKSFDLTSALTARPMRTDNGTSKFDLTLYLSETDDGMKATWQYNSDLYRKETISEIASQFMVLLDAIAENPECRLSELALIGPDVLNSMIVDWNDTVRHRQVNDSFVQLFERIVMQSGTNIALSDSADTSTYKQLNERANQIAHYLQARGVSANTLVAVCLPRSIDWIPVILGIWKAGGAYVPLDPDYPADRLNSMVQKIEPALVVGNRHTLQTIRQTRDEKFVLLDDEDAVIGGQPNGNLNSTVRAGDLAYVMFTSGSNGQPRGVKVTHGNVCHYAQSMVEALSVEATDRYLHTASFAFSSSVRQFVVPLACGATCVIASSEERRDPISLFTMLKAQGVSIIDLVPSHWMSCHSVLKSLSTSARNELLENSLRLILSASEPLPASVAHAWDSLFKSELKRINMYGQTETCGIVLMHAISDNDRDSSVIPLGRPIANTHAFVLDESLRVVPVGVCGELFIGGSGVASGYLNEPQQTAQSFMAKSNVPYVSCLPGAPNVPAEVKDGDELPYRLYRTGDLARYGADGKIEFVSRKDNRVKIRGFRVEPTEIENILCAHADVRESAVLAIKDIDATTSIEQFQLHGFVTLAPKAMQVLQAMRAANGRETNDFYSQILREFLQEQLPEYSVPRNITVLNHMPRTSTGKIDRIELRSRIGSGDCLASQINLDSYSYSESESESESESILKQVWKSVLKLEKIGVDENFFDIGGNSLLSVNVMVRAKELGLHFNLAQFYQYQTIAQLARVAVQSDTVPQEITVKVRPSASSVLVTVDSLRAYGIEALTRAGLEDDGARIVAEVQLEASLRGQSTHNMISVPRYAKRLATGKINPQPAIRIERETKVIAQINGDNGPGQWVSTVAMDVALGKAEESGVGIAVVRRSNHFGAAGHYVWAAAQRGMIGLCTTNGPLILAPTGGITPRFGNNPLGVGIPAQRYAPILLDIAMSVATRGKIGLSVAEGKPLSQGWILDRFGRSSVDLADLAAGLGVPIGGHKGYGLALVMEVLAGVLSGSGFCDDHSRDTMLQSNGPPDYGHFFMAIDPAQFMPAREFRERVDRLIEQTKAGDMAENTSEILVPGEMEMRERERSLKEGVRLRSSVYRALQSYAKDAGLSTELELIHAKVEA